MAAFGMTLAATLVGAASSAIAEEIGEISGQMKINYSGDNGIKLNGRVL